MEAIGELGQLDLSSSKEIDDVRNGYSLFFDGDVIVAKITPCFENGKGALALGLLNGIGYGTTELHVLTPGKEIHPRFLYYVTISEPFRRRGEAEMKGAAGQKRVPEDFIRDYQVAYPRYEEQSRIAAYLDRETSRIDALIAAKQRLIELLAEKRRALITQAVTKGLNPNTPMRDSGLPWLGEIPRHWEVCLLKRHFDVALGKMLDSKAQSGPGSPRPYLRAANIHWGRILTEDVNEMLFTEDEMSWYRLKKGDLLVTEGGVTVGRSAIWHDDLPECYYQNSLNRVRPKQGASPKLLYYWLYALKLNGYIDLLASKATFGHLTKEMLEEVPMLFVHKNEAEDIVAFLETEERRMDVLRNATERTIILLRKRRSALIAAAVTGKLNINENQPAVPA